MGAVAEGDVNLGLWHGRSKYEPCPGDPEVDPCRQALPCWQARPVSTCRPRRVSLLHEDRPTALAEVVQEEHGARAPALGWYSRVAT